MINVNMPLQPVNALGEPLTQGIEVVPQVRDAITVTETSPNVHTLDTQLVKPIANVDAFVNVKMAQWLRFISMFFTVHIEDLTVIQNPGSAPIHPIVYWGAFDSWPEAYWIVYVTVYVNHSPPFPNTANWRLGFSSFHIDYGFSWVLGGTTEFVYNGPATGPYPLTLTNWSLLANHLSYGESKWSFHNQANAKVGEYTTRYFNHIPGGGYSPLSFKGPITWFGDTWTLIGTVTNFSIDYVDNP